MQRSRHEVALSDLRQHSQASNMPDEDPLDRLSILHDRGPEEEVEMREEVKYLLSLVSEKDRYILELSYIQGLDGDALALELDCSYTAAQVRLCRARQRLRTALAKQKGESDE
jgi:DNA-directed RNA polymerase specialized sigma24 family protein